MPNALLLIALFSSLTIHAEAPAVRVVAASDELHFSLVETRTATTLAYRLCGHSPVNLAAVDECALLGVELPDTPAVRATVEAEFARNLDDQLTELGRWDSWTRIGKRAVAAGVGVAAAYTIVVYGLGRYVRFLNQFRMDSLGRDAYRIGLTYFTVFGSLEAATIPLLRGEQLRFGRVAKALAEGALPANDPNLRRTMVVPIVRALIDAVESTARGFAVYDHPAR